MKDINNSLKTFFFDLYLKPSLLLIATYQIVVSGTFTAQQLLLAAYLDELGYLESQSLFSGLILSIFFVFWFLLFSFTELLALNSLELLLTTGMLFCILFINMNVVA